MSQFYSVEETSILESSPSFSPGFPTGVWGPEYNLLQRWPPNIVSFSGWIFPKLTSTSEYNMKWVT